MIRCHDEPAVAEAAVTVIDQWQGRGLGRVLLDRQPDRARELGIERFRASLLSRNHAMLALFQHEGRVHAERTDGGVTEIVVDLPLDHEAEPMGAALRRTASGDVVAT